MKNLLIYLHPEKKFDELNEKLIQIQIENVQELYWKKEDILLVTNFPYRYRGIEAFVVEKGYCVENPPATKITTIAHLFEIDFFKDFLYWSHDLDAFQNEWIEENELGLGELEGGFNTYGRNDKWQMGSFFFKKGLGDIFKEILRRFPLGGWHKGGSLYDEYIMCQLTAEDFNHINSRIKTMNITYDFGMRRIAFCYERAIKPIRVVHFQPYSQFLDTLGRAMYGRNEVGIPLMSERLIKNFERHGIK